MTLKQRVLKLMAMRDHSVSELRAKLKKKQEYSDAEFAKVIGELTQKGFMPDEYILAEKVAQFLRRRGKGENWIKAQLFKKGLPTRAAGNSEAELETAKRILNKLKTTCSNKEAWAKRLINRGFTPYTVARVLGRQNEDFL